MMFLCNWLNGFGKIGQLSVSADYISGKQVYVGNESYINDTLRRGGVVIVRLYYDEWHYVLLTGVEDGKVSVFDPYYREEPYEEEDVRLITDEPFKRNCEVPVTYFNREELELYAFGPYESREAVLLFNDKTKLTEDKTIEYFI
jgi:hypothetical protein